ncbi:DUF1648 domain-containing protein [Vagococcus carniphilus]|uniref:DUF5808 domain-containing protein n=1 Tax=Vagococcus carniphilus TaxID=218144 RepID=A0A430APH9_9ENTE|nr:DUF5808 domain-containing protein [Vagococcus carniphilus]QNN72927.1 hypothetical protein H9L18_13920 [Vagococcus carniphilus]RSU10032.1 hypothetical protein CBF28_14125 [Vagococcus carniphilus]
MINVLVMLFFNLMIGLLMGLTPYYSKRDIPFGVTLPETDEAKTVMAHQKKSYLMINLFLSFLIGLGIVMYGLFQHTIDLERLMFFSVLGLFIQLIVSMGVYLAKYKQLKTFKKGLKTDGLKQPKMVIDLSFRDEKLIFPTGYLVGVNLAFVLLTVVLTVSQYQHIPESFVTKWDMNMNPIIMTDKTWKSVLAIPAFQLFLTFVMGISNQSYLKGKQRIDVKNTEESIARNKKFRKQSSLLNFVLSLLVQLLMMMIQLSIIFQQITPQTLMVASLVFTVAILGIVLWFSLYYGQGGDRLKTVNVSKEAPVKIDESASFDDDDHWKLGMFYFNQEDPSFWVEKRMGLGMTFNFAKWQSWAFLIGVIIIPIGIAFLMM